MVNITINKNGLTAVGHALFAPKGKDIVCAGISAIIIGGLNAFNDNDIKVELQSGLCDLTIYKLNEENKTILWLISKQLHSLCNDYTKNITIKGEI